MREKTGFCKSTHLGTSVISRLLLHVLQVETASLGDRPKTDTKVLAVGDARGTVFCKSTHLGTSVTSRQHLHVLQAETAPLGDRPKTDTKVLAVGNGRGTGF